MATALINPPPPPEKRRRRSRSRRRRTESTPDWGNGLPEDIVDLILQKSTPRLSDYVRFGAVCVSWRSATLRSHNQNTRIEYSLSSYSHHNRVPLLLFPNRNDSESESESEWESEWLWDLSLYSVIHRKLVCNDFKFLAPYANRRICGSSHGWLITATNVASPDSSSSSSISLTLVNPIYLGGGYSSCFRGVITLPLFNDPNPFNPPDNEFYFSISKVVLSADPALAPHHDYFVVVVYGPSHDELAFMKSGDTDWTFVDPYELQPKGCQDAIFHKNQIYITSWGALSILNINKPCLREVVSPPPNNSPPGETYTKHYVVESTSPESGLFLVSRYIRWVVFNVGPEVKEFYNTIGVCVFKLVDTGSLKSWAEIDSIGDNVLFLGDNYSTCLSASDVADLQPNCIYFTHDHIPHVRDEKDTYRSRHSDMFVFNLEDQSFRSILDDVVPLWYLLPNPAPIWFLPSQVKRPAMH